ncbi:MAG: PIN domain-containing protein [Geodermatophilaceae bacterium]|nr:PIN domain-containing protein [Geodermatophilaceae bacterium]MDQ3456706.1 PIN domain-containing protein [Actinomycetota bacterium]
MDAFDADVVIYAASADHPFGWRVRALLPGGPGDPPSGVGSVLLLPEVLRHPLRQQRTDELTALAALSGRLDLRPPDRATAELAAALGAAHRLRGSDAVHLATAVMAGADRFVTNNRRDFSTDIDEVTITYPDVLPEPGAVPPPSKSIG